MSTKPLSPLDVLGDRDGDDELLSVDHDTLNEGAVLKSDWACKKTSRIKQKVTICRNFQMVLNYQNYRKCFSLKTLWYHIQKSNLIIFQRLQWFSILIILISTMIHDVDIINLSILFTQTVHGVKLVTVFLVYFSCKVPNSSWFT